MNSTPGQTNDPSDFSGHATSSGQPFSDGLESLFGPLSGAQPTMSAPRLGIGGPDSFGQAGMGQGGGLDPAYAALLDYGQGGAGGQTAPSSLSDLFLGPGAAGAGMRGVPNLAGPTSGAMSLLASQTPRGGFPQGGGPQSGEPPVRWTIKELPYDLDEYFKALDRGQTTIWAKAGYEMSMDWANRLYRKVTGHMPYGYGGASDAEMDAYTDFGRIPAPQPGDLMAQFRRPNQAQTYGEVLQRTYGEFTGLSQKDAPYAYQALNVLGGFVDGAAMAPMTAMEAIKDPRRVAAEMVQSVNFLDPRISGPDRFGRVLNAIFTLAALKGHFASVRDYVAQAPELAPFRTRFEARQGGTPGGPGDLGGTFPNPQFKWRRRGDPKPNKYSSEAEFYAAAVNRPEENYGHYLGDVSQQAAHRMAADGVHQNLNGATVTIISDVVRHVNNGHGPNSGVVRPVGPNDLSDVLGTINHYDSVEVGHGATVDGKPRYIFTRRTPSGRRMVVVGIYDATQNRAMPQLKVQTFYREP